MTYSHNLYHCNLFYRVAHKIPLDSTAVLIFVGILVELTNTIFVTSTNITTNIETAVLSRYIIDDKNGFGFNPLFVHV